MDILKIESEFMTWAFGKFIKRLVKEKTGCKNVTVDLKALNVKFDGEMADVHLDIYGQLPKEALFKLLKDDDDE